MSASQEQGQATEGVLSDLGTIRRGAFYVSVLAAIALYVGMMREMLAVVFVGWFQPPGIHHLHELTLFGMIWLGILGLGVQLYRPDDRRNAVLVSALVMVPLGAIALSTGSPIAMMPLVFGAIGLLVVGLHPAGRGLLEIETGLPGLRVLGGMLGVAAVPLLAYAGLELVKQYTLTDPHIAFVHYGAMAHLAIVVLVLGALATVRDRDRRFAAWSAGGLAAYLGLTAVVYPAQPSSPGLLWGALAIVWGVAFVGAFEWTTREG